MINPSLNGLVLAGGKSSRMGFDKSQLSFHGSPQQKFLCDLLATICVKVFVSCKEPLDVDPPYEILADRYDIESPLNGILTAFNHDSNTAWLTVPVDMPGVDEQTLKYLIDNRDHNAMATCFYDSEGTKPEPLVTIWEPRSFPALNHFCEKGKISPREFLIQNQTRKLIAPNVEFHRNINTPGELNDFKINQSEI